ncbi:MAG: VCBS repeat-containing protein [Planctomycetes bacterium]|nr:VCBS repeat-containing protein [Planctomycetota bacterium]
MPEYEAQRLLLFSALAAIGSASLSVGQQVPLAGAQRAFETGAGAQLANTAYRPNEHVVADLNGDGALDVALSHLGNFTSAQISVLLNAGDGELLAPIYYPAPGETAAVVAADLDGDGDVDLAFSRSSEGGGSGQSVLVYRNDGMGRFGAPQQFACGRGPLAIVAGDWNGDGLIDLATANRAAGESDLSLLTNNGLGGFTRTDVPVGPEPYRLATGDLDGDGRPDLVSAHVGAAANEVRILRNTGSGFSAPTILMPDTQRFVQIPSLALGDVDQDGDLDLLYGYAPSTGVPGSSALGLWRNNGAGSFGAVQSISTGYELGGPFSLQIVDVTGDQVNDIIGCARLNHSQWSVLRGLGSGNFAAPQSFVCGEASRWISAADLDRDGDRDVLITNHGSMTLQVHRNEGGIFPGFTHLDVADSYRCESADIDGDGDLDLVALAVNIYVFRNNGRGAFTRTSFFPGGGRFRNFQLRDLDGDRLPEILMVKDSISAPYHFYTCRNLGSGSFAPYQTWTLPNSCGVYVFATLDFDGDGDLDVAANETGGCPSKPALQIYLLANQGNGTFATPTTMDKLGWGLGDLSAADVDRDGAMDLVGSGLTQFGGAPVPTNGFLVLRGRGFGTFDLPVAYPPAPYLQPSLVRAADLDGDGYVELIGAGLGTWGGQDHVVVMRNNGAGAFFPWSGRAAPYSLWYTGTNGLRIADFDNDSRPDVLVGGGEDLVLFKNQGDGRLAPPLRFGIGGQALWATSGDLNRDGAEDAIALAGRVPTTTASEMISIVFGVATARSLSGCSAQPAQLRALTPRAILGSTLLLELEASRTPNGFALLLWGELGLDTRGCGLILPGAGELLLALQPQPLMLSQGLLNGMPARLGVPVPNLPVFAGVRVAMQGVALDPASGASIELSNALVVPLGS